MRSLTTTLLLYLANLSMAQVSHFCVGDTIQFSEIETMSGDSYSIDQLDSDLLVMNFWNVGCKGCLIELPFLNKIHDNLKDESITFWSITLNRERGLTDYLSKHPIHWEIKGNVEFTGNFSDSQFNIKRMPATIVINKNKEILYAKSGPITDDENGAKFLTLLKTGQPWK